MNTFESRAAAAAAGTLVSFRGEERRQEFRTQMRSSTTSKDDKEFLTLDGYASVVETPYEMYDFYGAYNEVIDARAFDKTLSASPNVNYLVNHTGLSMARTGAGTLELSVDVTGLHTLAYLNPMRSDVRDLGIAVDDGAVEEMSFAFRIENGNWSPDYTEFRITQINLDRGDVSVVNYGANPYTSISARAKQGFDAAAHLEGEPLRMLVERAQARLAALGLTEPEPMIEPEKRGPSVRLLREALEL